MIPPKKSLKKLVSLSVIGVVTTVCIYAFANDELKIKKLDMDKDGVADIIQYYKGDLLTKQEQPELNNRYYEKRITIWKDKTTVDYQELIPNYKNVSTIRDKEEQKLFSKPFKHFFRAPHEVIIDGEKFYTQETDIDKTYGKKKVDGTSWIYTRDQKIVISKVVSKNGVIGGLYFYNEYGQLEKVFENFDRSRYFGHLTVYDKNHQTALERSRLF